MEPTVLIGLAGLVAIAFLAGALVVRPPLAPFSPWLSLCLLSAALWTLGEVLAVQAVTVSGKRVALAVLYTGSIFLPALWLVTVLRWVRFHAPRKRPPARGITRAALGLAAGFWLFMATDAWHGTFVTPVVGARNTYHAGFFALLAVGYLELLLATGLCVRLARSHPVREVRRASALLATATVAPLAANVFYVLSPVYLPSRFIGLALAASASAGVAAVWWGRSLWLLPLALPEVVRRDPSAVLLFDRGHRLVFRNAAARRLLAGIELGAHAPVLDALAARLRDGDGAAAAPDGTALLRSLREAGTAGRLFADGEASDVWLHVSELPLETSAATGSDEDELAGPLLLRVEDMSRLVRAEQARNELALRLLETEKLRSVSRLAAQMAHQFNNRLAVILGNATFAREELDPRSDVGEMLADIVGASEEAALLTRQLLSVAGRVRPEPERVSATRLLEAVAERLAGRESRLLAVEIDAPKELSPLSIDPRQLEQALVTLCRLACSRTRGVPAYVRLAARALAGGRRLALEVAADGAPWSSSERERLLGTLGLDDQPGSGLELAAALALLRANAGTLSLDRDASGRNLIVLSLPCAESGEEEVRAPAVEATEPWRASGLALVVDDEDAVRRVGAGMLARLGFTVRTAASGAEALSCVESLGAELRLVLLDLAMPGMDGAETLLRIRALAPDLPVILTSGHAGDEIDRDLVAKASAYLEKPYRLETLRARAQRALGREGGA